MRMGGRMCGSVASWRGKGYQGVWLGLGDGVGRVLDHEVSERKARDLRTGGWWTEDGVGKVMKA